MKQTPKEKAKELTKKLEPYSDPFDSKAHVKLALIAVDEMIDKLEDIKTYIDDNSLFDFNNSVIRFWKEVNQELEKM